MKVKNTQPLRVSRTTTSQPVSKPVADSPGTIARVIDRGVIVNPKPRQGFNGVSPIQLGGARAKFANFILDNSGGASSKIYVFGDPDGAIAAVSGKTLAAPDSGSISPVAFNKLAAQGFLISEITYGVTVSPTQFSNNFLLESVDVDGRGKYEPMDVAGAKKPNNFDPNLLVLDVDSDDPDSQVFLDRLHALTLVVAAGETVSMNFKFRAVG